MEWWSNGVMGRAEETRILTVKNAKGANVEAVESIDKETVQITSELQQ
jgi:hypothetical protein